MDATPRFSGGPCGGSGSWLAPDVAGGAGALRGSVLGWGWSFLTPLLMLAVYTFVFSQVFQARWGDLEQAGPWVSPSTCSPG